MEASFWHEKWEMNQIGFHEEDTHKLLLKHLGQLNLREGSRIFLPLCGKTRDIAWMLSEGYQVAGAELSDVAVKQLFDELGLTPNVSIAGSLTHYQAVNIDIFVGDIFDLSADTLGHVDAVYDRAALIALPTDTRSLYTSHLMAVTDTAPQLLICLEYDQSQMNGPPFSIVPSEVEQHYAAGYDLVLLEEAKLDNDLKGTIKANEAQETAWLLRKAT